MSEELCEGMTIVVEDRASVASQVKALIKANKVTEQFFSSLSIVNDNWIHASIEADQPVETTAYDLGVVFKAQTQNDISLFYRPPLSKKWTPAGIKKVLNSLE